MFHHDVVKLLVAILMDLEVPSLTGKVLDGRLGLRLVRGDGAGQGGVDGGQAMLGGGQGGNASTGQDASVLRLR